MTATVNSQCDGSKSSQGPNKLSRNKFQFTHTICLWIKGFSKVNYYLIVKISRTDDLIVLKYGTSSLEMLNFGPQILT